MDAQVNHPKYWMPLVWAGSIVQRARKENRIPNDYMMLALIEQIDKFRGMAGGCLNYDWINIPMVYTQVKLNVIFTKKYILIILQNLFSGCDFGRILISSFYFNGKAVLRPTKELQRPRN